MTVNVNLLSALERLKSSVGLSVFTVMSETEANSWTPATTSFKGWGDSLSQDGKL